MAEPAKDAFLLAYGFFPSNAKSKCAWRKVSECSLRLVRSRLRQSRHASRRRRERAAAKWPQSIPRTLSSGNAPHVPFQNLSSRMAGSAGGQCLLETVQVHDVPLATPRDERCQLEVP